MDRNQKEEVVRRLQESLAKACGTFLVDYQGLDVEKMSRVRKELGEIGTDFFVVKNRLLKLASSGTGTESIKEYFTGPNALAVSYDEMVKPAKILVDLAKDLEKLEIKVGQISGKPMDLNAVRRLAELPSHDDLLA